MKSKFELTIEMGNDAMRLRSHVSEALFKLAEDVANPSTRKTGKVIDANGNTVGSWKYTREPESE